MKELYSSGGGRGDEIRRRHHHATAAGSAASLKGKRVPQELKTLEVLRDHTNENLIAQSEWLPGVQRKRSTLDGLNPFAAAAEAGSSPRKPVHTLDLRRHTQISDDTFYLGSNPHPHDSNVELHSYAFVHYNSEVWQPRRSSSSHGSLSNVERSEKYRHFNRSSDMDTLRRRINSGDAAAAAAVIECGAPIAMGARWKNSRGYYIHPHNSGGMPAKQVILDAENAADTWRCVFRGVHLEPLGPLLGVIANDDDSPADSIDFQRPTGDNHIVFARMHLPDGGEDSTLAVTITHGVYAGPHSKRYIAEFSTIFNDAYLFANCADPDSRCSERKAIDFQSIATHELGHAHGLDDLYSKKCTDATMFWSAQPGETKKRSLTDDDKNSMIALYEYKRER